GANTLPHLKQQLAGVTIRPPAEALAEWLPKAKAEADAVVLLYYGSATSLRPLREKFGADLAAILVGGARPEQLPDGGSPPAVGTDEHGKSVARIAFGGFAAGAKAEVTQLPV